MTSAAAGGGSRSVFVLGAGRAGRSLARAFVVAGIDVVGVHGRHSDPAATPRVTAGVFPPSLGSAAVVLVTVRDAQLGDALRQLSDAALAPGAVVLHASGATDPAEAAFLRARGHAVGTLHPLVPLASPDRAATLLRDAWIGVDGDARAIAAAQALASRIGAHTLTIPPGEKPRYHAAAVFAANFPVVVAALAERLLVEAGVLESEARAATLGLMNAAVSNLETGRPHDVLTGPIARGDVGSVLGHLAALANDAPALDAYVTLSRAALTLAHERGTSAERLAEISAALDEAYRPPSAF
ncbi:MAG TPA: Rossmann-like and DUF2520 domain-containing protein [Gemmatimonadaceae bacterium]|nr:Rossmann-like and DUF2520 domain-containing protein [Gemmatimonadaceae bacterium]